MPAGVDATITLESCSQRSSNQSGLQPALPAAAGADEDCADAAGGEQDPLAESVSASPELPVARFTDVTQEVDEVGPGREGYVSAQWAAQPLGATVTDHCHDRVARAEEFFDTEVGTFRSRTQQGPPAQQLLGSRLGQTNAVTDAASGRIGRVQAVLGALANQDSQRVHPRGA
ncbi:hypothetical protein DKM19_42970 [Streptosporangium sp. 'caverna']|nr:hypothetical protein DKM19_42970 [Streptosporangium sp. 'caverna']